MSRRTPADLAEAAKRNIEAVREIASIEKEMEGALVAVQEILESRGFGHGSFYISEYEMSPNTYAGAFARELVELLLYGRTVELALTFDPEEDNDE